jgi:hypothetical protein
MMNIEPRRLALAAAALLAVGISAAPAQAGLLGETISVSYNFPDFGTDYGDFSASPPSFVVGAGIESIAVLDGGQFSIDFDDTSLTVTMIDDFGFVPTAFNGPVFTLLDGVFGGVASVSGVPVSRVLNTGPQLGIDWGGLFLEPGSQVVVTFGAVPEPASWALMIVGFGLTGATLRRRQRAFA